MPFKHDPNCLFCNIALGKEKAWILFENEDFMAFLTPFPNTPGFTVVATKSHLDSDVLSLEPSVFNEFMLYAREAAHKLDRTLGTARTALVIEGMAINHAHVKLIPLHGIGPDWEPHLSELTSFTPNYLGYITSLDGPRASDETLNDMQKRIQTGL